MVENRRPQSHGSHFLELLYRLSQETSTHFSQNEMNGAGAALPGQNWILNIMNRHIEENILSKAVINFFLYSAIFIQNWCLNELKLMRE